MRDDQMDLEAILEQEEVSELEPCPELLPDNGYETEFDEKYFVDLEKLNPELSAEHQPRLPNKRYYRSSFPSRSGPDSIYNGYHSCPRTDLEMSD